MQKILILIFSTLTFLIGCKKENQSLPQLYYPLGKLKQIKTYDSPSKTTLNSMTNYFYNTDGLFNRIDSYWRDTIKPLSYNTYEYFFKILVKECLYLNQQGQYNLSGTFKYIYENNKKSKKELYYGTEANYSHSWKYYYNSIDSLYHIKKEQVNPYFCWETYYEFDSSNRKILSKNYSESGTLSSMTKHYYPENSLIIDSVFNGNNLFQQKICYFYNSSSQLIKKTIWVNNQEYLIQ